MKLTDAILILEVGVEALKAILQTEGDGEITIQKIGAAKVDPDKLKKLKAEADRIRAEIQKVKG